MERQYVSVHALNRYIKAVLDNDMQLQTVYIRGEISNYRPHPSGHMYFTLKDDQTESSISAIMFASQARYLKFRLRDGMKVFITAQVSVFERAGRYQLYVRSMQEDGLGNLYLRFNELKQTLEREGLFNTMHKKAIPVMPERLAILSAKQGAALQDVLRTLHQRYPLVRRDIYPVPVQGRDAYKYIVETLSQIDQLGYSTILLVRGGGSIEDLWNFNEEALARCIYGLKTPIITGVGHETDFTLVDYVSDLRAPTPTAAAVAAVPSQKELLSHLENKIMQLSNVMRKTIYLEKQKLEKYTHSYVFTDPSRIFKIKFMKLDSVHLKLNNYKIRIKQKSHYEMHKKVIQLNTLIKQKQLIETKNISNKQELLKNCFENYLKNKKTSFSYCIEKLDLLSPLKTLQRGYIISKKNDSIIKSVKDLHTDDTITLVYADGEKEVIVK
ncbi:exodeoxyribonuclease VII large subunit [Catenibacterium sp. co_0103]|uniref:exodeoxyribonuclease VII large subunit n=1 Tax=unclassified Catenibacterium TaxID=2643636 RepID=UPI00101ED992|nr:MULTISPECIES: exodeoxyribonuclease VII large subunit [unclassified Catenibacterium]MZT12393.1 exodeoxyribonuclease VII large subunit [Catenibacterium sp. BIOML-A1]RYT48147.1 exodeoxyribonuclease VII large subunit [Catenibacterium sp. co_0103]